VGNPQGGATPSSQAQPNEKYCNLSRAKVQTFFDNTNIFVHFCKKNSLITEKPHYKQVKGIF